jgi:hypothetical protein
MGIERIGRQIFSLFHLTDKEEGSTYGFAGELALDCPECAG